MNKSDSRPHLNVMYVGPLASGKSTNIRYLHAQLDPALISELRSENSDVSFDFNPSADWNLLTTYTFFSVNGDFHKYLERGVHGIVFVVDSISNRMDENLDALKAIENQALEVPLVFQFNKRDHDDAASLDVIRTSLNPNDRRCIEAIATEGIGVFRTWSAIIELVNSR